MIKKVVVDTSSFIEYFRYGKEEYIPALALSDSIIVSNIVRLELLKGTKRSDRKVLLKFLDGLIQLEELPPAKLCESLLLKLHSRGLSLGIADLITLADTVRSKSLLLTSDRELEKAAKIAGVLLIS